MVLHLYDYVNIFNDVKNNSLVLPVYLLLQDLEPLLDCPLRLVDEPGHVPV